MQEILDLIDKISVVYKKKYKLDTESITRLNTLKEYVTNQTLVKAGTEWSIKMPSGGYLFIAPVYLRDLAYIKDDLTWLYKEIS